VPTALRVEGYRFFFYSNEGHEPPHIHVQKAEGIAKFWLKPKPVTADRGDYSGTSHAASGGMA
jgi:hypothetical protein